mgnify:FL=1
MACGCDGLPRVGPQWSGLSTGQGSFVVVVGKGLRTGAMRRHQTRFCVKPCTGKWSSPVFLRTVCDSLAALSQPVADLEVDEPSDAGVGGQGGQPVAAHVLEAQLGALMGPLSAHG